MTFLFISLFGVLLAASGVHVVRGALEQYRRGQLIRDTPTSTPGGVALGLAEVLGTAQPVSKPLSLPHEENSCLLYAYFFFHRNPQTQSRRDEEYTGEPSWKAYKWGYLGVPFFLTGDRGRVYVDPADAEIEFNPDQGGSYREPPSSPPSSSVSWQVEEGPPAEIQTFDDQLDALFEYRVDPIRHVEKDADLESSAHRVHQMAERIEERDAGKRAFYTERIDPGEELYLLGRAQSPDGEDVPDDVSAVFRSPDTHVTSEGVSFDTDPTDPEHIFRISPRSEKEIVADKKSSSTKNFVIGVILSIVGLGVTGGSLWMLFT